MKYISKLDAFFENKKKDFEDVVKTSGYYKGISKSTARKKAAQIKKQADMADDDPEAYQELPGDTKGKKLLKKSAHTKRYEELYGKTNESRLVSQIDSKYGRQLDAIIQKMMKDLRIHKSMVSTVLYDYLRSKYMQASGRPQVGDEMVVASVNEEEKAEGDRGPIDDDAIETGLKNKSKETGVPVEFLRIVMRRGMSAWKSGHRPGATQQQWGYSRVNSFLTKQPGTWGGADSDVAKEVRDGGYDKKLKKG